MAVVETMAASATRVAAAIICRGTVPRVTTATAEHATGQFDQISKKVTIIVLMQTYGLQRSTSTVLRILCYHCIPRVELSNDSPPLLVFVGVAARTTTPATATRKTLVTRAARTTSSATAARDSATSPSTAPTASSRSSRPCLDDECVATIVRLVTIA